MQQKQSQVKIQKLQQSSNELSNHNKAVNSIKQVTLIRKITQQTLSPVIKKIQQNIQNLLQQSKQLRSQTSTLKQVQATNIQYKQQIQSLKNKLNQLQKQLIDINQQRVLKQKDNDKKFVQIDGSIEQLTRQGDNKTQKIKKLTQLNQNQTQLFNLTKQGINSSIDILKTQISTFYQNSIKLHLQQNQKFTKIQSIISTHNKKLQFLQKQLRQVDSITALYKSQRDQIRKYLEQAIQLQHQAIRRQQYEKDKKYFKIDNQLTKSYVQKILHQALTPQIRSFLPNLIHNIQLLKKMQIQLKQCNQDITKCQQTQKQLSQKLLRFQYSTKKGIQQRQIQIKKLSISLQQQIQSLQQKLKSQQQKIQPKFMEIQSVLRKQKSDNDQMFQTFIQKNRTKIYLAVLQCKPPEVQQEQKRIKQKLQSFQIKMEQINSMANQRSDNVLNIGNTLDAKLDLFQNRITKAKSDLKVQNDNMKKIIQGFNKKLQQSQNKMHQQSQTISKLLQVIMLNTTLQIDDQYFQFSNNGKYSEDNHSSQSYISFHDGVIYEANADSRKNQTFYRKKKLNKQILKRTLLKQQAKLIDFITQQLKNWKWSDSKQRPSKFFIQNIYPSYQIMLSDKASLIQTRKSYEQKLSSFKMPSLKMIPQRRSRQSIGPGASTSRIQPMTSKHMAKGYVQDKKYNNTSIQMPRGGSLAQRISQMTGNQSQMHTTIDFYKPNRIKLKKIDQKQRQSKDYRDQSKNRYGKQTIE